MHKLFALLFFALSWQAFVQATERHRTQLEETHLASQRADKILSEYQRAFSELQILVIGKGPLLEVEQALGEFWTTEVRLQSAVVGVMIEAQHLEQWANFATSRGDVNTSLIRNALNLSVECQKYGIYVDHRPEDLELYRELFVYTTERAQRISEEWDQAQKDLNFRFEDLRQASGNEAKTRAVDQIEEAAKRLSILRGHMFSVGYIFARFDNHFERDRLSKDKYDLSKRLRLDHHRRRSSNLTKAQIETWSRTMGPESLGRLFK